MIAGIVQITYAFGSRKDGHIAWKLIIGVLYVLAGILIAANPLQGVLTLALVLGITIFMQSAIPGSHGISDAPCTKLGLGLVEWSSRHYFRNFYLVCMAI